MPFEQCSTYRNPFNPTESKFATEFAFLKEKLFALHVNRILTSIGFVLESVSIGISRNYLEAQDGLVFVRVFSKTNQVLVGSNPISPSAILDLST